MDIIYKKIALPLRRASFFRPLIPLFVDLPCKNIIKYAAKIFHIFGYKLQKIMYIYIYNLWRVMFVCKRHAKFMENTPHAYIKRWTYFRPTVSSQISRIYVGRFYLINSQNYPKTNHLNMFLQCEHNLKTYTTDITI